MKARPSARWLGPAGVVATLALLLAAGAKAQTAPASAAVARPLAVAPKGGEDGVRWQALTATQRGVLGPLEHEWPTIDAERKQKWLAIAGRFHTLPQPEQDRISARMTEWAKLSPAERGEVRLRFQEARQVPAPDRSARWEAYQKLPPKERQQFAARAATSVPAASASRRSATPAEDSQAKANVVPNPALAQPPRPVSPTVLQASHGATTRLITRSAVPPAHQQTGMPKIAATPEFVNRSTLLPRRGPQAAAVVPVGVPSTVPGSGTLFVREVPVPPPGLPASAAAASTPSR